MIALEFLRTSTVVSPLQSGSTAGQTATVIVGIARTVNVASARAVPPGPVAVAVNVCDVVGVIDVEPLAETVPKCRLTFTAKASRCDAFNHSINGLSSGTGK